MEQKRSKLYFRIESFYNSKAIKAPVFFVRLTELNNKNRTKEKHFGRNFPYDLELLTYTGKYQGIIVTIRYKKGEGREFLDEFVIPYGLIPYKRNVKFERTIEPPAGLKNLISQLNYPKLTFLIDDHPYDPNADPSSDLYKTALTVTKTTTAFGPEYSHIDRPFSNFSSPVDKSKKSDISIFSDYQDIVIDYKKFRDTIFKKKKYPPLPLIDLDDNKTITQEYNKLFYTKESPISLMTEEQILKFEGYNDLENTEIPIKEEHGINYFFDFNYD